MSDKIKQRVYVVVTKPQNLVGIETARQLAALAETSKIYIACPRTGKEQTTEAVANLNQDQNIFRLTWFDPFGSKEKVADSALKLIESIQETHIDGILLNPYGAGSDNEGIVRPESGVIELAELKVVGNTILVNLLLEKGLLGEGSRVLYSSSESARGLPKLGIPVPKLEPTIESFVSHMDGSGYVKPFQWMYAYAYLSCILALHVAAMARKHPQVYFTVASPGMTQDSFNTDNVPSPTIGFKIQMFLYLHLFLPLLKKYEIAQDYTDAAKLFLKAMTGTGWEYPSGTFVAAKSGTGGPVCDQFEVPNGQIFRDETMQDLAYAAVGTFLR
jgi:hypothetical protein